MPEDISVTGYDCLPLASEITTVKQNFEEIGHMAIIEVLKRIGGAPPSIVTTGVSLHIGKSVKKID